MSWLRGTESTGGKIVDDGPMAELLCALEEQREPEISGRRNLLTMALVDACYRSARSHKAESPHEILAECLAQP